MTSEVSAGEVLDFWFGEIRDGWTAEDRGGLWFRDGAKHDAEITRRFGGAVDAAGRGKLDNWAEAEKGGVGVGVVALVIVLDQFTRCVHRGRALAFSNDLRAAARTEWALAQELDAGMIAPHLQFLYMPLMHSEDLARQERSVELFGRLTSSFPPERRELGENIMRHAREHRDIIARFGRFPHRNAILGRKSAPEEEKWLAENQGKNYGQSAK